jgi:hypothetical protein
MFKQQSKAKLSFSKKLIYNMQMQLTFVTISNIYICKQKCQWITMGHHMCCDGNFETNCGTMCFKSGMRLLAFVQCLVSISICMKLNIVINQVVQVLPFMYGTIDDELETIYG